MVFSVFVVSITFPDNILPLVQLHKDSISTYYTVSGFALTSIKKNAPLGILQGRLSNSIEHESLQRLIRFHVENEIKHSV